MFRILGKSKIAFILAILFGISLFFFKSGSRYSNFFNSDSVVASVSGTPISTSKYNRTLQMNINQFSEMLGKQLSSEEIRGFQLPNLALRALINDAIFEDEFDDLNFIIDEKVIAKKTKERLPKLYNKNNKLNEDYLNTFLQQQQLKIEDVVQIINFETRNEYFSDALFKLNYPKLFSKQINNVDKQERKISYIKIPTENYLMNKKIILEGEEFNTNLTNYYNKNIQNYLSDETRDVEYILIDKNNLNFKYQPNSTEVSKYYDENINTFSTNEKRTFIQFNFNLPEDAKNFQKNIVSMGTKEILEYSIKKNIKYTEFQNLASNEILEAISDSLFKLKIDEKSEIIKTSLSNHIIILKSITPLYQKSFNEVKNEIKDIISKNEIENYFRELNEKIDDSILNGANIKNLSDNFNLQINNLKNLTRNYDNDDKKNELFIKNLINMSFKSNKDFVSDLIKVNNDIFYIFNVKNIAKSEPIDLTEIRNKVQNDWLINEKIKDIKNSVLENIDNNFFINNISKKYNITPTEITINNFNTELSANYISKIFSSKINKNFQITDKTNSFIARIDKIIIPKDSDEVFNPIPLNNELRSSFGEVIMEDKKIKTNDNLISALIDQY